MTDWLTGGVDWLRIVFIGYISGLILSSPFFFLLTESEWFEGYVRGFKLTSLVFYILTDGVDWLRERFKLAGP